MPVYHATQGPCYLCKRSDHDQMTEWNYVGYMGIYKARICLTCLGQREDDLQVLRDVVDTACRAQEVDMPVEAHKLREALEDEGVL